MSIRDPYLTLLCGLPGFDALFAQKIPPLSRLRLNQHLQLLDDNHQQQLTAAEAIINWSAWPAQTADQDAHARIISYLADISDPRLRQLVSAKLDLRAINAALRYRQQQRQQAADDRPELSPPAGHWCVSRYQAVIERHWQEEEFSLGNAFPWITDALPLLREGQVLALEKLILQQAWRHLNRQQPEDEFSFFAVALYVFKWNIADRWSRFNAQLASQRFRQLLLSFEPPPGSVHNAETYP